jgi:hypothetical protein
MDVIATTLSGELLRPREKLSSDSFASENLSDPKRADEEMKNPWQSVRLPCSARFDIFRFLACPT